MWKRATGQTRTRAGCSQPCGIWSPAGNFKEFHWWAPKISVTSTEPDKMWSQCVPFCSWVENLKIVSKVFLQKIMMLHEADLWPFGFKTGIRIMILSYCTICVKFLHNWMVHEGTVTFQEKEHFTSKSKFLFLAEIFRFSYLSRGEHFCQICRITWSLTSNITYKWKDWKGNPTTSLVTSTEAQFSFAFLKSVNKIWFLWV